MATSLKGPHDGRTALLLVDIDHFEAINDTCGHAGGDIALCHVADLVRSVVRGEHGIVARLGGDELAVLLVGCEDDVARRGQELVDLVGNTGVTIAGQTVHVTVSVGLAHARPRVHDHASLFELADGALHEAKRAGRGRLRAV